MIKRISVYILVFTSLFVATLFLHSNYNEKEEIVLNFSLNGVYLFHAVFSLLTCIIFSFFSLNQKFLQQLGFIYLGAIAFKIILFCVVFYNSILSSEKLSDIESISLLIPLFIFLMAEVYFIAKILNKNNG